jgi:pimeloyl-[acyl-carrier protein] methyl ester esterase
MEKIRCILLPGLDGTGDLSKQFAAAISNYANPTIISYPKDEYHGYHELVDYVLAKLPVNEEYCIIAESFSGPIAISIASRRPKNLKCITLVATFASNPFPMLSSLFLKLLPFLKKLAIPKHLISFFLLGSDKVEIIDKVSDVVNSVDRDILAYRIKNVLACDVTSQLEQIAIPVLAIRATKDRLIPRSCSSNIYKYLPSAIKCQVDAPHFLLQVKANEASEIIKPFLLKVFEQ